MSELTRYTFDTLPENLKAEAIEDNRNINVEDADWHDCILDDWKQKLEDLGYGDVEISYSGFWSQGDGASFTSSQVPCHSTDPAVQEAWLQLTAAASLLGIPFTDELSELACGKVFRSASRYYHEYTVDVDWEDLMDFPYDKEFDRYDPLHDAKLAVSAAIAAYYEGLTEPVRELCREIYQSLEKEYEYLTEDEQVEAVLVANEYEFEVDEEGELV